ncbi:MAG TPA: ROK family transcriptional regulator [Candidatus Latescibacteria bacterium]|nr:ROK family transcriptional regulator [Candidatus Latescibacterota bacterium]
MVSAVVISGREDLTRNTSAVIDIIRRHGPVSRKQIAELTGLSPAALTNIVGNLIDQGLVHEVGLDVSSGGRKPILLQLNPDAGFVVGVDIGSVNLRVGVTDLAGKALAFNQEKSEAESGSQGLFDRVIHKIQVTIKDSGIDDGRIKGIGIGISAVVHPQTGVCLFCRNMPGWEGLAVRKMFTERLKKEVLIDDSMRTMALAEKRFGKGRGVDNMIHICLGNGVGAGIFIEGKMYRGSWGVAGELGHITVDENGPLCRCGNRGCLESLVSGRAIVQRALIYLQEGVSSSIYAAVNGDLGKVTPEIIAEAARKGDKVAHNIMNETGEHLGIGIANAVNLFNPELVVIGGGLAGAADLLLEPVTRTVKARGLQVAADSLKIEVSELGQKAGVLGAASLVLDELFKPISGR